MPSPTSIGRAAEQLATEFLRDRGFSILDRNWRNRWCELDIVARHDGTIHFIEVKYRANTAFGLPAEFVRRDKIARLVRATLAWNQAHRYAGPFQIDIISISGPLGSPSIELLDNAVVG